ncbi:centrosome-associated protein ALMS1 isoform X3 [Melanerpes formicivorus]|uniref:centrosome-associated protein ALMS1 isoform X3 n=1 Tax=Melanerpes formicivorus TaxID=211600 RepID=UPI00358F6EA1
MEPGQEEEEEEERVPPIATTPPRRGWKEESLSRSSSDTQASATSGISLGEAIRQQTAGMESWYQLAPEVDGSNLTAASGTKLGLTCDKSDLTEFPTLEEGVLPSAETSRRQYPGDIAHRLLLGVQDTQSSLRRPLLRYLQGQRFSDETSLQQSEMSFRPLRGVPDVSGVSEQHSKPSCIPEAVSLTDAEFPSGSFPLSQHPLSFRALEPCDASSSGCLSQQTSLSGQLLVSKEGNGGCRNRANEEASILQTRDSLANSTSEVMLSQANGLSQVEAPLAKQSCSTSVKGEHFSCSSNVPAAGLELSEKEKGSVRHEEFSSSENSSCKTALTKNSEKSEREVPKGKVKLAESESKRCVRQLEELEKEVKVPELGLSNNLSDELKTVSCKNPDAQDVSSAETSGMGKVMWREHGVDLNGSESLKFMAATEELKGAFLSHHKAPSPTGRFEKEEFIPAVTATSDCASKQLVVSDMEAPSCRENAPVEAEPEASRSELTISGVSILKGYTVTGISPSFNLVGDGSFSVHLPHPSYQSTPGVLLKKNMKVGELGGVVIKSDIQASSPCLNEETSGRSSASTPVSVEKQHALQCAQKEESEHLKSFKWKYPHSGRIQSLPSLSFMEKVRAWNVSQPEEVPDAVTPCQPSGGSPGRKAHSAIASSSNYMMPAQKRSRDPKDDTGASSRELGSLGSLHCHNKSLLLDHPLTRSQSDNAVNVCSWNVALAGVVPPPNSTEAVKPLNEKSDVLGEKSDALRVSENTSGGSLVQKFTAEVEDAESTGPSSDPNVFVSGEGVAQLPREERNLPTDGQKNCDAPENQSHNLNIPPGRVCMDYFGDISPDSLNLLVSSGESSHGASCSAGCSAVSSKHFLPSAKDDDFIPVGAASLGTPEKEELNIEERIPIYLRNLGIDQSPGTILTPFVPRGPIREVEFSPSELRTLKDSTDTLTRTVPQPQGRMLSALETTQTSFNFGTSTLSMSVPTNSEAGSDILSPHELSPHFSRSFGDKPVSQCSVSRHQPETAALLSTQWEEECLAVSKPAQLSQQLQSVPPSCHADRQGPMLLANSVQDLLAEKEVKDVNRSLQSWTDASLPGLRSEGEVDKRSQSSSLGSKRNKSQGSHSVIGSGALQEIHKLLAEVKDIVGMRVEPVSASSREADESPLVLNSKEDGPKDSRLMEDSIPQGEKVLSWDETTTQRSMQEEGLVIRPLNFKACSLRQENSDFSLHNSKDVMRKMSQDFRTAKSVGRSEPEGCSSVTTDRNQPGLVGLAQSKGSSEVSTLRASDLETPPSLEPQGSITEVAGGSQSKLSKGSVAGSKAGDTRGSDDSSSGDSLAARVKSLLRNPPSSELPASATHVPEGFQSVLSKAASARSKAGGPRESDDSSSGDSLAAHVKNLLRSGSPAAHTTQMLSSTDEEERKSPAWVKLRLASCSEDSLSDWNEEDQRRIEEIKAELLQSAQKSALAKHPWMRGSKAASEHSHSQEQDTEHFKAPSDKTLQPDSQLQGIGSKELAESSLGQSVPLPRADPAECCLLKDRHFQSVSTVQSPTCHQRQAAATRHSDAVQLPPPLQQAWDTCRVRSAAASAAHTAASPAAQKQLSTDTRCEDAAKQVTSITFASRKRLQAPLTPLALSSSLSRDGLDGIKPLEPDSVSTKEQSHGKQHGEEAKSCPPSSPMLAGWVSNENVFTAEKDRFHHVSADRNRAGAHQETDCLSVSIHAEERQTLSAKRSDVLPQDVTALGRHSARLVGLDCHTRLSQEMKGFDESHSTNSYQQEKHSPPGHSKLCGSLEGSDAALQSDLLKGHIKLLGEKKKSPGEAPLLQKEATREQMGLSHHSSADDILPTSSVPSSPTKKALSGVHITLSSKCSSPELHRAVNTDSERRWRDEPEVNTQPVTSKTPETVIETVPKLSAAGLTQEDQKCSPLPTPVSSADPCLLLPSVPVTAGQELPLKSSERPQVTALGSWTGSLKNISSSAAPAKTEKSTSDATTQITTESPEKITFSSEIYVHSQDSGKPVPQPCPQKAQEPPSNAASTLNKTASLPRQSAQPILLPYKPLGSTRMYYVPYLKARSKVSAAGSEGSVESSHSERRDPSKAVKTTHPLFKSAQSCLHHPTPQCESSLPSNSELSESSSGAGHPRPCSRCVLQRGKKGRRQQRVGSGRHEKGGEDEFFPLTAEADYSKIEDLSGSRSLGSKTPGQELYQHSRREAGQKAARNYPGPCSQTTRLKERVERDPAPRQRTHSSGSLDELWIKFLECQKKHQHHDFRRSGELTLVERLDRLARVLQNPIKHTLMPTRSDKRLSGERTKGREQKKTRLPEKGMAEGTSQPNATHVEERARIAHEKKAFVELRKSRAGEKIIHHTNKILEHLQFLESPSDTSSEARLSRDHGSTISSTISESEVGTHRELEASPQSEVSSSISTIDTARLIRAFGRDRVRLSSSLSQLYWTINLQKSRSEEQEEGSGNAVGAEHPEVTSERHRKGKETQNAASMPWDSTSASSSSWGPSSALSNKRRTRRMLNKGIQAGDLEIVNSATKKNTRDVGVTFPTPRPSQPNQRPQEPWHRVEGILGESDGVVTDHQAAGSQGEQKGQPGNFLMEKRTKRSRLHFPQAGVSWVIQAEDLKAESRKENHSNSFSGPGPSWFEPWASIKPWREPLREKNWQEQQHSHMTEPAAQDRRAESRSLRPPVKLTLQEALAAHRPDFISRSGERVKHLKLVMEERKIQSVLQAEREELFNPPEKRKGYRNASHLLAERGLLVGEKRRTVPRSEMVQRSKRIYEQLPEVRKRREEEKRKAEYNSYRLRAQLYKRKITNRVLGRKVPWN